MPPKRGNYVLKRRRTRSQPASPEPESPRESDKEGSNLHEFQDGDQEEEQEGEPATGSQDDVRDQDLRLQEQLSAAYEKGRKDAEQAARKPLVQHLSVGDAADASRKRSDRWREPGLDSVASAPGFRVKPKESYGGGLNLHSFLTDFLAVASTNGWDPRTTRLTLRHYLEGPALLAYDDLAMEYRGKGREMHEVPIPEVVAHLESLFLSAAAVGRAQVTLYRLKKDSAESVIDFLGRFRQAAQLAGVQDGPGLAATFLHATKMAIPNMNYQRLREAADAAMRWEEARDLSDDDGSSKTKRTKVHMVAPISSRTQDGDSSDESTLPSSSRRQTAKRPSVRLQVAAIGVRQPANARDQSAQSISREALLSSETCAICSKTGHAAVGCYRLLGAIKDAGTITSKPDPRPPRQDDRNNRPFKRPRYDNNVNGYQRQDSRKCYGCGQVGHVRSACPSSVLRQSNGCPTCGSPDAHAGQSCWEAMERVRREADSRAKDSNKDPRAYVSVSSSVPTNQVEVGSPPEQDQSKCPLDQLTLAAIGQLDGTLCASFKSGRKRPFKISTSGSQQDKVPSSITLDGRINNYPARVVVDTGAQVTVISEALYKRIRSPSLTSVSTSATGAAGEKLIVLGSLNVLFTFGERSWPFCVWVIRGLRSQVLLGQDFGQKYPMIIETSVPTVTIEGARVPILKDDTRPDSAVPQVQALIAVQNLTEGAQDTSNTVNVVAVEDSVWPADSFFSEVMVKVNGAIPSGWLVPDSLVLIDPSWFGTGALLTRAIKRSEDLKSIFYLGGVNTTGTPVRIVQDQVLARATLMEGLIALISLDDDVQRDASQKELEDKGDVGLDVDNVKGSNHPLERTLYREEDRICRNDGGRLCPRPEAVEVEVHRQGSGRVDGLGTADREVHESTRSSGSRLTIGRDVLWDRHRLVRRKEGRTRIGTVLESTPMLRAVGDGETAWIVTEGVHDHTQGSRDRAATPKRMLVRSLQSCDESAVEGTDDCSRGHRQELCCDERGAEPVEVGAHHRQDVGSRESRPRSVSHSGNDSRTQPGFVARALQRDGGQRALSDPVHGDSVAGNVGSRAAGERKGVADDSVGDERDPVRIDCDSGNDALDYVGAEQRLEPDAFQKEIDEKVLGRNSVLTDEQRRQLTGVLMKYRDVLRPEVLGLAKDEEYDIQIPPWEVPVKFNDRRWSAKEIQQISDEISKLLKGKFIEPANGPWASRLVLVVKKDGSTRVCVDYRGVNEKTITDAYPTPVLEQVVGTLAGNVWFSTLDAEKGYYQIKLSERSKQITAFTCPFGLFQWSKMPFGLKNAPAYFQRVMDMALSGLSWKCCMVFFDDIVVFSRTWEQHLIDLAEVFDRLRSKNITLNFGKCEFARNELVYLGHLVDKNGLRPNPVKVEAVARFQEPVNVAQLRRFLGMTGQFRRFIRGYADLARPLQELVKEGTGKKRDNTLLESVWLDAQQQSFDGLKDALTKVTLLRFPDPSASFIVTTDASDFAIGAMLSQKGTDAIETPVEFVSRLLSKPELNYHATEREGLAVVFAVQRFRHYLHGAHFEVRTDHKALEFIFKNPEPKGRLARWAVILSEFEFTVKHKPGSTNQVADALSRQENAEAPEDTQDVADVVVHPPIQHVQVSLEPQVVSKSVEDSVRSLAQGGQPISLTTWSTAQETDPLFGYMYRWLKNRRVPDDLEMARWVAVSDVDYAIVGSVLYRTETRKEFDTVVSRPLVVVPTVFRDAVCLHFHASETLGAHQALSKSYTKLRASFWWPGMYQRLKTLIDECTVCQSLREIPGSSKITGRISPKYEFHVVGMDLLALPESADGLKYVVVAVDHFTRYAWVKPVKNKTADAILSAFKDMAFPADRPSILLTDNGTEFKNKAMADYCRANRIEQHFVIPYHPQSDGLVERFNRTLLTMMRAYVDEAGSDWPLHVQRVCSAYNATPHSTNGASPATLLYKTPAAQNVVDTAESLADMGGVDADDLRKWLQSYRDEHQKRTDQSNNRRRSEYPPFAVGDLVWCLDFSPKAGGKLAKNWIGPWTVIDKAGDVTYVIRQVGGRGDKRRAHREHLSAFRVSKTTPPHLRVTKEPPVPAEALRRTAKRRSSAAVTTDSDDDDDGYEVEQVVGHYSSEFGFWFLLKWKGYDELSWSHEDEMECPRLVSDYFRGFGHSASDSIN